MNLMSRLTADGRRAKRLRQARAAIRHADRSVARRRRISNPGYDELLDPVFICVIVIAAAVLVLDIRGIFDSSVPVEWARSLVLTARAAL